MPFLLAILAFFLFFPASPPSICGWQSTPSLQAAPLTRSPHFSEFTAILSRNHLLLFARLENSITAEMQEILRSGIPLEFTFFTEFLRSAGGSSEQISVSNFKHSISYDTLKDEYQVSFEENHNRSQSFPTLEAAALALNTINGMKIISAGQLIPNNSYTLRLRADLFHKTLPPGLEILPFFTWDDHKTEWQEIMFHY